MQLCYSGSSRPSAIKLREALSELGYDTDLVRRSDGDINWGRADARTELNSDPSQATNKSRMRNAFAEHGIPAPRLYTAQDIRQTYAEGRQAVFVGRPDTHTRGQGFWLIQDVRGLERALRGTRRKRAATHFMEYIQAETEYRVHVFRGKSLRVSEKHFYIDEFGERKYTTVRPSCGEDMRRALRRAAKQAVAALGLDFGAVDILAAGDEVYVLEVNTAPGLGGSMPRVYAEAFIKWKEGQ